MKIITRTTISNIVLLICFIVVCLAIQATANDLGLKAYNKGDYATALKVWEKLAKQGDAGAQYSLGKMYFAGKGVPQDKEKAIKWFTTAAENGDNFSQYTLGGIYAEGKGVLQDFVQAYVWYNIAASQGNETALNARNTALKNMSPDQVTEGQKLFKQLYKKIYGK
ncbi:sel1 repeat family protein [Patescibacteria group bacterium]|nr:sel1 repeat family protein [Patescibacteria group bacterium]